MKKVLGIVRASTDRQETYSQKKELIVYLKGFGFTSDEIEILEVAGASARKRNQKYLQMLETVKLTILSNKTIKAVGLWNLDRLGRVDDSLIEMKNWFISNKIQLYCKSPSLVLLNEDGSVNGGAEIAFGVFASLIKQQTEDIFNKFKRGKDRNRTEGKYNGGNTVKFGYKVDQSNYIVPDEEEAKLVNLIFRMYSTGDFSTNTLAKELNELGYKNRGKKIEAYFISSIIRNTTYIGCKKFEPLVDKSLWDKVKAVRFNSNLRKVTKETKHSNFAIKILRCPVCGANYIYSDRFYACYRNKCKTRLDESERCYGSCYINKNIMDGLLWRVASMNHINYLSKITGDSLVEYESQKNTIILKLDELNKKISFINSRMSRIKRLYLDGDLNDNEYKAEKDKVISDRDKYIGEIERYNDEIERINKVIDAVKNQDKGERFVNMVYDVENNTNYELQNNIIHQHITEAYCKKILGEKVLVLIKDIIGNNWYFIYSPNNKRYNKGNYLWCYLPKSNRVIPIDERENKIENKNCNKIIFGEVKIEQTPEEKLLEALSGNLN